MTKRVKDKKITVLGAARSGLAAARLLKKQGARVFVSDYAEESSMPAARQQLIEDHIAYEFGQHSEKAYKADMVVLSPGIPARSPVVQSFITKGIPVYSEVEVASWFCRAPIIAVTGSNGKTTTTTLLGKMLDTVYSDAIVAGNIGRAFSEYVDASHEKTWAALEVSSFQLETIDKFHPRVAVVLNFAPNHLNRYESYKDYIRAKWRVTKNLRPSDLLVYNYADEMVRAYAGRCDARLRSFDIEGREMAEAFYRNDGLYLNGQRVIDAASMPLKGIHNYMNAMAAMLAAEQAAVSVVQMQSVLQSFKGVEHRLEFVRNLNNIKFINDSKATTIESLSFALRSFEEPVVLIAGGKDKGSDFKRLNALIEERVRSVILIGDASEKMAATWKGIKPIYKKSSLQKAVEKALSCAKSGDVVLLSPACASFDMFKDFEERGRSFKTIVNNLKS